MSHYHLVLKSSNVKVGPIPVTTSSRDTCPDACPFKRNGCYADQAPLVFHWNKVTSGERGGDLESLCSSIASLPDGQLWRHNQAGDLPTKDGQTIDFAGLQQLVKANKGKKGFTYTHFDIESNVANRFNVEDANLDGFTINVSANSLEHADKLRALTTAPIVAVITPDMPSKGLTPAGNKYTTCPAQTKDNVNCASCQLCQKQRDVIVAFVAHGNGAKKVINIVRAAA